MRKILILIIIFFVFFSNIYATHNRAGEITYKHISGFTYEVTITTFTYTLSQADRDSLELQWGDNTSSKLKRYQKITLPHNYYQNIYKGTHTYSGPGIFELIMEDPNRNDDVTNIPNSVNVVFALKTTLQINPLLGHNNTPILLNKPIDKAAINQVSKECERLQYFFSCKKTFSFSASSATFAVNS